jgi:hypothetical protein
MHPWLGYLAAVLLPFFYTELPGVVVYRWHWGRPVPPHVAHRVATEWNAVPFFALAGLGICLWWLILWSRVPPISIGWTSTRWQVALLLGVLVGGAWLSLSAYLLLLIVRARKSRLAQHLLLQHSVLYLIPIGLCAAVVEEVWRGFCIAALHDHGDVTGVVVTAVATGWAHIHPRARALSSIVFAICAAGLFLTMRSLWTTIPMHAAVNIGMPYLIRVAFKQAPAELGE